MRLRLLSFLLLLALPLAAGLSQPAAGAALPKLRGIEISGGARPEIMIRLDAPVSAPKSFVLADPLRLIVDIAADAPVRRSVEGGGSLLRIRAGQFDPQTVRLVIDLGRPMTIIAAEQRADNRLVLQLAATARSSFEARLGKPRQTITPFAGGASATVATPGPATVKPGAATDFDLPDGVFGAATSTPAPIPPGPTPAATTRTTARLPLVMIDAGHGGKDVGAIPVDAGTPPLRFEKDVTLAIARATAAALRASGKVRVRLTRDDDRFIPLGGRVAIARRAKADLFISIHADSAPNPLARGASVYTLSETASDAVSARLAARENQADIIAGVNLGVDAPGVGDIMIDLARRDTLNRSVAFAEVLQRRLEPAVGFRGAFHHFAGFYVLKAPDVPSVLLETGYVSNVDDVQFLFSREGQRAIANGIAGAVEAFLVPAEPAAD